MPPRGPPWCVRVYSQEGSTATPVRETGTTCRRPEAARAAGRLVTRLRRDRAAGDQPQPKPLPDGAAQPPPELLAPPMFLRKLVNF